MQCNQHSITGEKELSVSFAPNMPGRGTLGLEHEVARDILGNSIFLRRPICRLSLLRAVPSPFCTEEFLPSGQI